MGIFVCSVCGYNNKPIDIILVRRIMHRLYNYTDSVARANNKENRWGDKLLHNKHGLSCNEDVSANTYDTDNNAMHDDSYDDGYGKQDMLNHGKCIDSTHHSTQAHHMYGSTINSIIDTDNDDNGSASTVDMHYDGTKYKSYSECGENTAIPIDRKHASINNTVDGDTKRWYINYIHPLWYINNGDRLYSYNTLRISLHIVDNDICNLLVRYDWTQCETVCIVNWHTTLISLYSNASLSDSKMAYDTCGATGNIRTEDNNNNDTYCPFAMKSQMKT